MKQFVKRMTPYLYEGIYMVPLCILVAGSLSMIFDVTPSLLQYLGVVGFYVYLLLWKYLGKKEKVLLGILSVLFAAGGIGSLIGLLGISYTLTLLPWLIWPLYGLLANVMSAIMHIFLAKVFAGLGILTWMVCAMVCQLPLPRVCVSAAFFLLLVIVVEGIQRSWKKDGYGEAQMHVTYISAFLLALVVVTQMIPVSSQKCEWVLVKKAYHATVEGVQNFWYSMPWGGALNYDKSSIGFSGVAELGGSLKAEGKKVMDVKAGVMPGPTLYLAGKVFDSYDGVRWENTDTSTYNDRTLDALLLMNAAWNYADQAEEWYASDYYKECSLELRYMGIRSNYLFAPTKAILDRSFLSEERARTESGNVKFRHIRGYKTSYAMPYYYMNQGNAVFRDFLESAHGENYANWDRLLINYGLLGNPDFTYDKVAEREAYIRELYLPETTVSPELRAYMDALFAGATTDAEKLQRLESDLGSFQYTLEPGLLPADVQSPEAFLDYFVLDSRQGYCSYFATAFVLMARAEGIPARYIQGFAVPVETTERIDVLSNMAHAWPEVYFEGLGWVAYEPTPGYANPFSWYTRAEMDAFRSSQTQPAPQPVTGPQLQSQGEQGATLPQQEAKRFVFHWYMLVLPLGLCVFGFICYLIFGKMMERYRYKTLCAEKQIRVMFWKNVGILGILGLGMAEGETLASYAKRMEEAGIELSFLPAYEKMLYSKPLKGEELAELLAQEEDSYIALRKLIHGKNKLSLWKFALFHEMKLV